MISRDLSKHEGLNTDLKTVQEMNFTGNVELTGNTMMFFIIEEVRRNHLRFLKKTRESILILFCFNITL